MAIRELKDYYFKMTAQYLEMKADLADFEQAMKDGFITEDQLQEAFAEVNKVQQNYERLSYIMYLLSLPNRKSKQAKYNKNNSELLAEFESRNATAEAVELENKDALKAFKEEIKQFQRK